MIHTYIVSSTVAALGGHCAPAEEIGGTSSAYNVFQGRITSRMTDAPKHMMHPRLPVKMIFLGYHRILVQSRANIT